MFLPSLVLAFLVQRSLRDQELIVAQQQRVLFQEVADSTAASVVDYLKEIQRDFGLAVDALLAESDLPSLSTRFDGELRRAWPEAEVGFVVTLQGTMMCPSLGQGDSVASQFRLQNSQFFCGTDPAEVYLMSTKGAMKAVTNESKLFTKGGSRRKVQPEHGTKGESGLTVTESAFVDVVGEAQEGMLSRFLDDELNFMVWRRLPQNPELVFGARLSMSKITEGIGAKLELPEDLRASIAVAVINDRVEPVAVMPSAMQANWRRPFVATEIGEALPHWEAAVYLQNPAVVTSAASSVRWTMGALLAVLLLLIVVGCVVVAMALQRRMTLARQQTDFVSNVSHELKTPLTSIRMFSEMLTEGRVQSEEKRARYLRIITGEANRLTRLINNVVDFSRSERQTAAVRRERIDLSQLLDDTLEMLRPRLEERGFELERHGLAQPVWVEGDPDALSQVFVNLLSNAEKYSFENKSVEVELQAKSGGFELQFKDRGLGFPPESSEMIFDEFYRAPEVVRKGAQGSGLGLTLSRRIVAAHSGRLGARNRGDGGSVFSVWLPAIESVEK